MDIRALKTLLAIACIILPPVTEVAAQAAADPGPLSLDELREVYASPSSRFVEVDGVELHYTDEGAGFPVLLLNASYTNLESWRDVAAALIPDYRVIRLDFPATGLSGNETHPPPAGKWNLVGRNVEVVSAFLDQLAIERVNLVATSSGGSVAFRIASQQPARVNRLILINSAGMPRTRQTDPNRERADIAAWQKMRFKPRAYWEYAVGRNFPSAAAPPDWFLDLLYDINRREPAADRSQYVFTTGNPQEILAGITAPTLILWGEANPTVMHLEADVMSHWMTAAPTLVKKYEGLGHYPYVEAPGTVIPDIVSFLAGKMDAQLRQTVRARVTINAR